jgi:hypothetical protein
MGFRRIIAPMLVGWLSLSAGAQALGASTDGHDLYLVPPSQTSIVQFASPYPPAQDPVDQAIHDFSRVLGQASLADRAKVRDLCKTGAPASASLEQRYAWAASCRYSRR